MGPLRNCGREVGDAFLCLKNRQIPCLLGMALPILLGAGCAGDQINPPSTPTPICSQSGTLGSGKITVPGSEPSFSYLIYLPPCYELYSGTAYPVLYWTAIGGQSALDVADQLILQGKLSPFLLVMLNIGPAEGYGADERIILNAVPYIDAHYQTRAERQQRSIAGISHGAAIAARAAFRAPGTFGRVAVISGGISDVEQGKFAGWVEATPAEQWPAVLIDVGDQDTIITLTRYLTEVLDGQGVPYVFTQGSGGHNTAYWRSRMADYLEWLVTAP